VAENRNDGLLVRAEPLGLAEDISQRMVDVVRIVGGALLLEIDPPWAGAIKTVLVKKGVRDNELRLCTLREDTGRPHTSCGGQAQARLRGAA
jgi:hypothetical protein